MIFVSSFDVASAGSSSLPSVNSSFAALDISPSTGLSLGLGLGREFSDEAEDVWSLGPLSSLRGKETHRHSTTQHNTAQHVRLKSKDVEGGGRSEEI